MPMMTMGNDNPKFPGSQISQVWSMPAAIGRCQPSLPVSRCSFSHSISFPPTCQRDRERGVGKSPRNTCLGLVDRVDGYHRTCMRLLIWQHVDVGAGTTTHISLLWFYAHQRDRKRGVGKSPRNTCLGLVDRVDGYHRTCMRLLIWQHVDVGAGTTTHISLLWFYAHRFASLRHRSRLRQNIAPTIITLKRMEGKGKRHLWTQQLPVWY